MSFQQLWAPWRLSYLKQSATDVSPDVTSLRFLPGADPHCFLCQSAVDWTNPTRHVVECGDLALAMLNRFPYNNGHLLVAPRRHCARLDELSAEEQSAILQMIIKMVGLLEQVLHPEGFNLGLNLGSAAGAGVPGHLHWHIVPRWNGDTNFMLTIGSVKVIPQALEELRETLVQAIAAMERAPGTPRGGHDVQ